MARYLLLHKEQYYFFHFRREASQMKNRYSIRCAVVCAVLLASIAPLANAALIKGDFLNHGDGFLIADGTTNFEWLTPFYTRGHTFNDSTVQSLITTYEFRYATGTEVLDMINNNFNHPTTVDGGDPAGFASAQSFFDVFGINDYRMCGAYSPQDCPRTQGLSSYPGPDNSSHLAFGMMQIKQTNGWLIANNPWLDATVDIQMGSWLVRNQSVPEPGTYTMLLAGLGLLGFFTGRRRKNLAA